MFLIVCMRMYVSFYVRVCVCVRVLACVGLLSCVYTEIHRDVLLYGFADVRVLVRGYFCACACVCVNNGN